MPCAEYRIHNIDDVFSMARHLAQYFANPADVITGIHELLMNAIEHGNLGIGYQLKTQLVHRGTWDAEIAARAATEPYASRVVDIHVQWDAAWTVLSIRDAGDGFDWLYHLHRAIEEPWSHGRGLSLARQCGFVSLAFNARGNEVTCRGTVSDLRAQETSRHAHGRPVMLTGA